MDKYHRTQIYGAKVNLRISKNPKQALFWAKKLRALRNSAKQLEKSYKNKGGHNA